MDANEFRECGYHIVDWIAGYMENGYEGPVFPQVEPGDILAQLPEHPPERAEPSRAVLEDFWHIILPGITHWNDPRFFGYFPANHSGPAILGELLSAGLGVNAMSWATSPAATELEMRMMRWLGEMIGLPWKGCIQDTASTASLCAILSARERLIEGNRNGLSDSRPMTVYATEHAHSSIIKAVRIAGIGDTHLRIVPHDSGFAMRPQALAALIERDLTDGLLPCAVVGSVGTTASTAIDPIPELAELCRRNRLWLHVDAALAGAAAILPERRWLMDGVEAADSFVFNPHKWLFTNFDCCAYFVKDPFHLKKALAAQPDYLKTDFDAKVENFRDWGIQLGRRFRALKLWWVIRCYGIAGLREKLRLHLKMATWFAARVQAEPRFHLIAEPKLNTLCFHLDCDTETEALLQAVNASGRAFLTHARLEGRYIIRVSFGQTHSRFEHAKQLWDLVVEQLPD